MALITKLSSAFTDPTLPILQKDPVLPAAGGVFLLDSKNPGSWSGASTIETSAPLNSLARATAADGTNPGQGYWTTYGTPTDLATISKPLAYDSATGRITFPSAGTNNAARFIESQAQGRYLFNATDAFCISAWVYITSTGSLLLLTLQQAGSDNNRNGLLISALPGPGGAGGAAGGFQVIRPSRVGYPISPGVTASTRTDNYAYGGSNNSPAALTSGVHRLGYAWYRKADGNWYSRPILDQTIGAELATPTHVTTGLDLGQTTAGGARDPYWVAALGNRVQNAPNTFGTSNALCRLYIENLTVSGRTPEQVWAADWARGNGRFS